MATNSFSGNNSFAGGNTFAGTNSFVGATPDTSTNSFVGQNSFVKPRDLAATQPPTANDQKRLLAQYEAQRSAYDESVTPWAQRKYTWMPQLGEKQDEWAGGNLDIDVFKRNQEIDFYKENPWLRPDYKSAPSVSGLQTGLDGYTTHDLGRGEYGIFDAAGRPLGTGFHDVSTAVQQIMDSNRIGRGGRARRYLTGGNLAEFAYNQEQPSGETWADKQAGYDKYRTLIADYGLYDDRAAWKAATDGSIQKIHNDALALQNQPTGLESGWTTDGRPVYLFGGTPWGKMEDSWGRKTKKPSYGGGAFSDWENLGQALAGRGTYNEAKPNLAPVNFKDESISGKNTLFGSKPMFYNGRLIGYNTDLSIGGGFGTTDKVNNDTAYLGRKLENPELHDDLTQSLGGTERFVPLKNVNDLPGWTNTEKMQYGRAKSSGAGTLGRVLPGAILSFVNPFLGAAYNAVSSAARGDSRGVGMSLLGGAIGGLGKYANLGALSGAPVEVATSTAGNAANTMSGAAGGVFGSGVSLGGSLYDNLAQNTLLGAGKGLLQGGVSKALGGNDDLMSSLGYGALGSAVGGGTNALLSSMSSSPSVNGALSQFVAGSAKNLINKDRRSKSANDAAWRQLAINSALGGLR